MKTKKTIKVSQLIDLANDQLSREITIEQKEGIILMLENVLHATNSYSGFVFLDPSDSQFGTDGFYKRRYLNYKLL